MAPAIMTAHSRLESRSLGPILTVLLAAIAIIVGLLAMHSMEAGAASAAAHRHDIGPHSHPSTQSAAHSQPETDVPSAGAVLVPLHDCDGMCAADCLAIGIACTLALIAMILTIGARRVLRTQLASRRHPSNPPDVVDLRREPDRDAPSLTALSISRT